MNVLDPAFQLEKPVRESFPNVQDAGSKSNLVLAALSSALAYENLAKIRNVITADWQVFTISLSYLSFAIMRVRILRYEERVLRLRCKLELARGSHEA